MPQPRFALAAASCLLLATTPATAFAAGTAATPASPPRATGAATPSASETARAAAPVLPPLVLVLPFTAKTGAEPDWLSWGIAEFVGEGMALAGFRVVDPEARQVALEATGLDSEKRLTLASSCELGRRCGARYVVTGTWRSDGTKLSFTAKIVDVSALKLVREGSANSHVSLMAPALGGIILDVTGDAGKVPAARRELERLAQLKQDALMAWMQSTAEPDNAVQHLTAALAADPGFNRARLDLAEAYLDADRATSVALALQPIGPDAALPHRARAKVLLGRAALALGDVPGSIPLLAEGSRLDPQPEHLLWLGEAHLAAGQKEQARDIARRVLGMLPGDEHAQDLLDQAEGRAPAATDEAGEAPGDEPEPHDGLEPGGATNG